MKQRKKIKIKNMILKKESKKYFSTKKCRWCGEAFEPINPNHQYCCEVCKDLAHLKKNSERVRKFRKRYNKLSDWIGTGHLSEKRDEDFTKELQYITNELLRLKLK